MNATAIVPKVRRLGDLNPGDEFAVEDIPMRLVRHGAIGRLSGARRPGLRLVMCVATGGLLEGETFLLSRNREVLT